VVLWSGIFWSSGSSDPTIQFLLIFLFSFILFFFFFFVSASRSILAVDGTFLNSLFKGVLLIAAQKDANNQIVILAFAVVGVENAYNWQWFLRNFYLDFPGTTVILADYHSGLDRVRKASKEIKFARCVKHMIAKYDESHFRGWRSRSS